MPSEQLKEQVEFIEDSEIIRAMISNGGGFVKALGEAASRADSRNLQRIKDGFSDYWNAYREVAVALRKRNNLRPEF